MIHKSFFNIFEALSNKTNLYFACSSPLTLNRSVETDYVQYVSKINTLDFESLISFLPTLRLKTPFKLCSKRFEKKNLLVLAKMAKTREPKKMSFSPKRPTML